MFVINRKGQKIPVKYDEITERNKNLSKDLNIDPASLSQSVIKGLKSGMTTRAIDVLSSENAIFKSVYEPEYAILAARICISDLHKITPSTFTEAMTIAYSKSLITKDIYDFTIKYTTEIENMIDCTRDYKYSYFGYKTLLNSYLLSYTENGEKIMIERPQYMIMRVCIGIHTDSIESVFESYEYMSNLCFTHATPTLFNSGTPKNQLASCFLLTCGDSMEDISRCWAESATISKFAGGIGIDITPIRGKGAHIRGTNGTSNGVIPFARVFQAIAKAIDQGGGKRPGSISLSLKVWHPDTVDFLDLKIQEKPEDFRTLDLHTALWIPDIFFERLEEAQSSIDQESVLWSFFQPNDYPELITLYGDDFKRRYLELEKEGKYTSRIKIVKLWRSIVKSLESAGEPYIISQDNVNRQNMQMNLGTITSTNLCCEIMEYHNENSIAVCNLASISLPSCIENDTFDFSKLSSIVKVIVRNLNKIIDKNYYPIESAKANNFKNRPIGIGIQGLADIFAMLKYTWDSKEASDLNKKIAEEIYFNALEESNRLAREQGSYSSFEGSPMSKGIFHFEMLGEFTELTKDWEPLRENIVKYGLRNSLLVAPMPTASTSQILGNNEAFEPYTSNVYVRKTGAGYNQIINRHLYSTLNSIGLWNKEIVDQILDNDGSVQNIDQIPSDIKDIYKTSWELGSKVIIKLAADRQKFVDQSQSMNIFMPRPTITKLTSMYLYGWKKGLKTLSYYVRSKPSTGAVKFSLEAKSKIECTDEVCTMCSA